MLLWILLFMIAAYILMIKFGRKQQEKMLAQRKALLEEALVPGAWVKTRAGFYGTVVEVDGDVVTLATPLGDESLWDKNFIVGAEEPPFGPANADEDEEGGLVDAKDSGDPADPNDPADPDDPDDSNDGDIDGATTSH